MGRTNEYLAEVEGFVRGDKTIPTADLLAVRHRYVSLYSWAIPNENALGALAGIGPIVEIGAGTGYWAYLLKQRGVDIKAFDLHPPNKRPNSYHAADRVWTSVLIGGPRKAAQHPNRTLLLCWPPQASPMAEQALEHFRGQRVAYIGEWRGCTATHSFHDHLSTDWILAESFKLPNWPGARDTLSIWNRRRSKDNKNAADH